MIDKKRNDVKNMSFEEALKELETITNNFEDGDSTLENAVNLYERGIVLKKHCEKKLQEVKKKIAEVKINNEKSLIDKKSENIKEDG